MVVEWLGRSGTLTRWGSTVVLRIRMGAPVIPKELDADGKETGDRIAGAVIPFEVLRGGTSSATRGVG